MRSRCNKPHHFRRHFPLPCGERDLREILPSLTLACTRSSRLKHNYPHTVHLCCLFSSWRWLGCALRAGLGVHLTLVAGSLCLVLSQCASRLAAWQSMCVCVRGKMAAVKYNSSCYSSLSDCGKSQALTDSIIYNLAATI